VTLRPLLASTTFRLSILYLALFTGSLLIILAIIFWSSVGYMRQQTDVAIDTEIAGLAERYDAAGTAGVSRLITDRLNNKRPNTDSVYLLTDTRGRSIVGNLDRWPGAPITGEKDWIDFTVEHPRDGPRPVRARTFRLRGGYGLLVGRDINALATIEQRLQRSILVAAGVSILLGILSAVLLARAVMRRIGIINETSQSIVRSGDLTRRVPVSESGDEFDALASNLNHMLVRIEDLLVGIRRVSDSVAHDLRTPLTRLRNRLEIMVHDAEREPSSEDSDDGQREIQRSMLESALADTDHLLDTFNALLRIARIETGNTRHNISNLNLRTLLDDVVELYEPTAEEARIVLTQIGESDVFVDGDRDLLFQAIANLVDNAIKFAPGDSEITISCGASLNATWLTVSDRGPGIDENLREDVFQRFFRADTSRNSAGNGLGLSLVKAVTRLHNAEISLESTQNEDQTTAADHGPGLTVRMTFPRTEAG